MTEETDTGAIVLHQKWVELTGEEPPKETSLLPPSQLKMLEASFAPSMEAILNMAEIANEIEVTNENDEAGMAEARRIRIAVKNIRTACKNDVFEKEKEIPRIAGRSVDWYWRQVRERAEIIEDKMKAMEEFAERKKAERIKALREEREELLFPYVDSVEYFNLGVMEQEAFEKLLDTCKTAHEARVEKMRQEEQELAARQQAEREEAARLKAENERLRAENEEKDKEIAAQRRENTAADLAGQPEPDGDKEKLGRFYTIIRGIRIPELDDEEIRLSIQDSKDVFLAAIAEEGDKIQSPLP